MPRRQQDEASEAGGKVRVSFYSGYKGEEAPRALFIAGREHPVDEILERKRIRDEASGETFDLFVCRSAGRIATIRMDRTGHCAISPAHAFSASKKDHPGPRS